MQKSPNIVISRMVSAYQKWLPVISAANAENGSAFGGGLLRTVSSPAHRAKAYAETVPEGAAGGSRRCQPVYMPMSLM